MFLTRFLIIPVVTMALTLPALAAGPPPVTRTVEGTLDDIVAAVENAIINAGLVIEGQSHVGQMLARTKADVGGTKDVFAGAEVFTFCSARVSRAMMERDPLNIQFCPYSIFVYETPDAPGRIVVGHRDYAADGVPEVSEMLKPIIAAAVE